MSPSATRVAGGVAVPSLGLLYSKLKRWNEAVPELEKAASLQDKNPLMQISLGEAYIASLVHLAHASRADRRDDLVWSQMNAGSELHLFSICLMLAYRRRQHPTD